MHRDVVVVGAGAVGLSAAQALTDTNLSVSLIEAGHSHTGSGPGSLVGGVDNSGHNHYGAVGGWGTGLGGTTQLWGGQLWAWEDYEFQPRPIVDAPRWPVNRRDLVPHYRHFLSMIGEEDRLSTALLGPSSEYENADRVGPAYLKYSAWLPWRKRNLYRVTNPRLRDGGIQILSGYEVRQIDEGFADRIRLELRHLTGARETLTCRLLVLAAGTLGNVRLLQLSQATTSPWLGKGFMDHVTARYRSFVVSNPHLFMKRAGARYRHTTLYTPRLVMHPQFARDTGSTGAFAHWEVELPQYSGLRVLRDILRERQRGIPLPTRLQWGELVARAPKELAAATYARAILRRRPLPKGSLVHLQIDLEQPPRAQSTLDWTRAANADDLNVHWVIGEEERRTFRQFAEALSETLDIEALGLAPIPSMGDPELRDSFHMMGGTRLSHDIADGVVDDNQRLHGVPNILVVGASVFPTGGIANPTMTAVALGLRAVDKAVEDLQ